MRATHLRAERRRRMLVAGGAIGVVVAVVAALVVVRTAGLGGGGTATPSSSAAGSAVVRAVTSVPAATLNQVGAGAAQALPKSVDAPALTADGKPKMLYVGAEYCPFCAAERWPVVVALSRFGTWSQLGATTSASNDVFPNTPTLSFHGANYSSRYLAFTGIETRSNKLENGTYAPLDTLDPADQKIFETYNRPPYTSQAGGIPFIDIAGRYVSAGASYSPQVLQGKTRAEIAAALKNPGGPVAHAVDGAANVLTAAICDVTGGKPSRVCTSPGVEAAASRLAKAS